MLANARLWFNRILSDVLLAHLPFHILFHCSLLECNGTQNWVILVRSCITHQTLNRFRADLPVSFPLYVSISRSFSNDALSRLHYLGCRIFMEHFFVVWFELSIIWAKTDLIFGLKLKLLELVRREDRILLFSPCRFYKRKMFEKLGSFSISHAASLVKRISSVTILACIGHLVKQIKTIYGSNLL